MKVYLAQIKVKAAHQLFSICYLFVFWLFVCLPVCIVLIQITLVRTLCGILRAS